jgi:hypothetical protein
VLDGPLRSATRSSPRAGEMSAPPSSFCARQGGSPSDAQLRWKSESDDNRAFHRDCGRRDHDPWRPHDAGETGRSAGHPRLRAPEQRQHSHRRGRGDVCRRGEPPDLERVRTARTGRAAWTSWPAGTPGPRRYRIHVIGASRPTNADGSVPAGARPAGWTVSVTPFSHDAFAEVVCAKIVRSAPRPGVPPLRPAAPKP